MLFEQNIASNVTRNVTKARPNMPNHSEQLLGTYRNLVNLDKQETFDFHKKSHRKKERRKK